MPSAAPRPSVRAPRPSIVWWVTRPGAEGDGSAIPNELGGCPALPCPARPRLDAAAEYLSTSDGERAARRPWSFAFPPPPVGPDRPEQLVIEEAEGLLQQHREDDAEDEQPLLQRLVRRVTRFGRDEPDERREQQRDQPEKGPAGGGGQRVMIGGGRGRGKFLLLLLLPLARQTLR